MKIIITSIAALGLLVVPAQANEICFTKALNGSDINPPMCFVAEPLVQTSGGGEPCEWVLIPSGGSRCVFDRPPPPLPIAPEELGYN